MRIILKLFYELNGGNMKFKLSAGIFVSGLLLIVLGTIVGFVGLLVTSTGGYYAGSQSAIGAFVAFIGFAGSLAGVIMMYVGAIRALRIIDALPGALSLSPQGHAPINQAPIRQPAAHQYQAYTRPQTPQHLVYEEERPGQRPPL